MAGSVLEERVENEGFFAAFGGGRQRFGAVIRIEHAWPACFFGIGIGRCRDGCRRRSRRQVEAAFAAAACERQHGRAAQKDDGPSRRSRAVVAIHDKNPQCGGTIQRLPCETCISIKPITKTMQPNPASAMMTDCWTRGRTEMV